MTAIAFVVVVIGGSYRRGNKAAGAAALEFIWYGRSSWIRRGCEIVLFIVYSFVFLQKFRENVKFRDKNKVNAH